LYLYNLDSFRKLNCDDLVKKTTLLIITAFCLVSFIQQIKASTLIDSAPIANRSLFGTFGYEFMIGSNDLLVNALGVLVSDSRYLEATQVGIWDASGTLLASVTIPPWTSDPFTNKFSWADLPTATTLVAGSNYFVGASTGNFNSTLCAVGPLTSFSPDATLISSAVNGQYSFSFPRQREMLNQAIVGPNIAYSVVVPEPSQISMLLLSFLVVGGITLSSRRRRAIRLN
jgi:hypothetical protein